MARHRSSSLHEAGMQGRAVRGTHSVLLSEGILRPCYLDVCFSKMGVSYDVSYSPVARSEMLTLRYFLAWGAGLKKWETSLFCTYFFLSRQQDRSDSPFLCGGMGVFCVCF